MMSVEKTDRGYEGRADGEKDLSRYLNLLGMETGSPEAFAASLPFSPGDATAGAENELQAVVKGSRENIDLAAAIEESNYYKNIVRRAGVGEISLKRIVELAEFLEEESGGVWENSWVRFPRSRLNAYANHILGIDLMRDKKDPASPVRSDAGRFLFMKEGAEFVRVPVSYLLKIALADIIGTDPKVHPLVRVTGEKLMHHFSNDNTSPEIFSFHPVRADSTAGMGRKLAEETAKRFLLTQLLVSYANAKFHLGRHGQEAMVYFSSTPPLRQKKLNECISDSFYRELFMSPCLSGWDRGEEKSRYMGLCHKVLSRSQINAVSKLKEAGIITSNLVVLPNTSNTSLANNGTHISLGSRKLTGLMESRDSGFTRGDEKYLGDLSIKISEHFLPLFSGTYSAAPFRLDFKDFHPEKVLGFMPHQLDFTHLRMIWRRWKKKADLNVMGRPVTPFGPEWIDGMFSRVFRLKGDLVPDYRLVDYLASLMSTNGSSALDGSLAGEGQLKKDLAEMGIFDEKMPLYQLLRLRKFSEIGFSGCEGRHYSMFESITEDMGGAADLQMLISTLSYRYILTGEVAHGDIPDDPFVESERRQAFFCGAIGIPTFFVRGDTKNYFMVKILKKVYGKRNSRRYAGYVRVPFKEFRWGLIRLLREDAGDLIEMFGMESLMDDLSARVEKPALYSVSGKLLTGVLDEASAKDPMKLSAEEFNSAAENYYRNGLRKKQMKEGIALLEKQFEEMDLWGAYRELSYSDAVKSVLNHADAAAFLAGAKESIMEETASPDTLGKLIDLTVLSIHRDMVRFEKGNR